MKCIYELQVTQDMTQPTQNCVYIECSPLIDMQQDQNAFIPPPQINYNVQPQNHLPLGNYSLQTVTPVQVYNGTYTMPLQQMQSTNMLHNQVIQQIQPPPQQLPQTQQIMQPQIIPQPAMEDKEKSKRGKMKKEVKIEDMNKQCPVCNKEFATPTKLSRHQKTHSTDMPFKCKVCNKAFSHSGNYKIHLRMHTDERPFRCTVCDKGCRQAQDLEKHMRTHTGIVN